MSVYTRVYDNYSQAQHAVRDLESIGIPSGEISLVANKHVSSQYDNVDPTSAAGTGAGVGAAVGGGAGFLAGLPGVGLLAIPGLGPVVAAGWLAATAVGAIAGGATGGIIGALVSSGLPENDAHVYSEAVRRGSTLLTVRTSSADARIEPLLNKYQPVDAASRRSEYEKAGWKTFDPLAPPYRPSETEIDRMRRTYD